MSFLGAYESDINTLCTLGVLGEWCKQTAPFDLSNELVRAQQVPKH